MESAIPCLAPVTVLWYCSESSLDWGVTYLWFCGYYCLHSSCCLQFRVGAPLCCLPRAPSAGDLCCPLWLESESTIRRLLLLFATCRAETQPPKILCYYPVNPAQKRLSLTAASCSVSKHTTGLRSNSISFLKLGKRIWGNWVIQ